MLTAQRFFPFCVNLDIDETSLSGYITHSYSLKVCLVVQYEWVCCALVGRQPLGGKGDMKVVAQSKANEGGEGSNRTYAHPPSTMHAPKGVSLSLSLSFSLAAG
jgi:hypothetical protein